jgi:hypothetical protein
MKIATTPLSSEWDSICEDASPLSTDGMQYDLSTGWEDKDLIKPSFDVQQHLIAPPPLTVLPSLSLIYQFPKTPPNRHPYLKLEGSNSRIELVTGYNIPLKVQLHCPGDPPVKLNPPACLYARLFVIDSGKDVTESLILEGCPTASRKLHPELGLLCTAEFTGEVYIFLSIVCHFLYFAFVQKKKQQGRRALH